MKGAAAQASGDRALSGQRKTTLKDPRLPSPLKGGAASRAADGDDQAARARKSALEPTRAAAPNRLGSGFAPSPWQ